MIVNHPKLGAVEIVCNRLNAIHLRASQFTWSFRTSPTAIYRQKSETAMKPKPLTELLRRSYPGCVGGYYSDTLLVALCKLPIPVKIQVSNGLGGLGAISPLTVCKADWEIIKVGLDNNVERHFLPDKEIEGQSVENWFHSKFCT